MPLLTNSIKTSFVKEFYESIVDPRSTDRYYVFYGGAKARENEEVVPEPLDTIEEENSSKRNTIFYNHILPSDVSLMIKRYNWTSGTVYDQYEDDIDLSDKKYYVLVLEDSEYRVYMCLSNNGATPSLFAPEGTNTQEIVTADGYIWKFMYSLTEQMKKFMTEDYIPIEEITEISYPDERALALDVKLDAVNGFIEKITVDSSVSFTNLVNPNNNNTHKVSTVNNLTFTVQLLSDLATSSNYYNNNYIVYFPETGKVGTIETYTVSGNTATITLCEIYPDNGTNNNIETDDVYSILPKVNILGNGFGAVAVPVFVNNILTSINIINGGTGYNVANAYLLAGPDVDISVVIPPDGGYGFDIVNELKPRHLMIRKEFKFSNIVEGGSRYFGAGASIRQYGVVKNIQSNEEPVVPVNYETYDMTLLVDPQTSITGSNYYYSGSLDFNSINLVTNTTHIIGADTFTSAKVDEISVNPTDPRLFNLKISEVKGFFEKAKLNIDGTVALGERIVFVKKTQSGISNDFTLVSAPKSVYGLSQSVLPTTTPENIRTSVVQKIKLIRNNSSVLDESIIPTGSYLYREPVTISNNETVDAAAAYILSVAEKQISGSDIIATVYILTEKGSFILGDDLVCVKDPFAKQIELFNSTCAGNAGVGVSVNLAPSSYDDISINKYSGTILYTQNIEKLDLSSNSILTTKTMLGF
jgi:hypothetical protein